MRRILGHSGGRGLVERVERREDVVVVMETRLSSLSSPTLKSNTTKDKVKIIVFSLSR